MNYPSVNTNPTTRTLPNGRVISFYSPHQIEHIVAPVHRLPPSGDNNLFTSHSTVTEKKQGFNERKDE